MHGGRYSYQNSEYINSKSKVCITCSKHGDFYQTASDHIRGSGCPKCRIDNAKDNWCSKVTKSNLGSIYLAKFNNDVDSFIKIGITTQDFSKRFRGRKLSGNYNIECLYFYSSEDKQYIWDLEQQIKNDFKEHAYKPHTYFGGAMTECFSTSVEDQIKQYLTSKTTFKNE